MRKYKYSVRLLATLLAVVLSMPVAVYAAGSKQINDTSGIPTVAQSYTAKNALQQGLIVQLDGTSTTAVIPATYKDAKKTLGIVVSASNTPISLSTAGTSKQAYVVTSGRYNVLVTNQNGAIGTGDYVGVSAIDGLGMKADSTESSVVGRAVGSFDGKTNVISNTTLTTSNGRKLQVAIGAIAVDVSVGQNPLQTLGGNGVPQIAQKLAVAVTGKPINARQLYAGLAVLAFGLVLAGTLLYSGIRTSMIATGRNPLAKQSILRNLTQVVVVSVIIFLGCLIAVYLILKL